MGVLRDARNQVTHRDLMKLTSVTTIAIVVANASDSDKYDTTWWHFRTPNDSTIAVARRDTLRVSLLEN